MLCLTVVEPQCEEERSLITSLCRIDAQTLLEIHFTKKIKILIVNFTESLHLGKLYACFLLLLLLFFCETRAIFNLTLLWKLHTLPE